jgi:hydrogenase-4 component B
VVLPVAFYGPGHLREYERGRQPLWAPGLFTGLFMAGMQLVVLADDAFALWCRGR